MKYRYVYPSIVGNLLLESDGEYLTKLEFIHDSTIEYNSNSSGVFNETIKWLDIYFNGINPDFIPKYRYEKISSFAKDVLDITSKIPYGHEITYGDIAKEIALKRDIKKMSAQAVGGALNKNCICIIVPCHRVIGQNGNLVGFGGKVKNKIKLLELEGNDMSKYYYKGDLND